MLSFLSLHAAGAVAAHELGDVGDGDAVEIAGDAVLQAARRDCELERRLLVLILVQPVDQAARKAVTAAHAVDNVPNFVLFRHIKVLAVVQARRPAVPVRTVALSPRDGNALHVRIAFQNLICRVLCTFRGPARRTQH